MKLTQKDYITIMALLKMEIDIAMKDGNKEKQRRLVDAQYAIEQIGTY
jgi:hypothetical protein